MNLNGYEPLICPQALAKKVKGSALSNSVAKAPKEILELSREELEFRFRPTNVDIILKQNFWLEILKRFNRPDKIDPKIIYEGVCSYTHWYNNFLGNPLRLAWLLSSGKNIDGLIEMHRILALEKIREILLKNISEDQKLNYRLIEAKIKIFGALEHLR